MPFLISLNDFWFFFFVLFGAGRKIEILVDRVGCCWQLLCRLQDKRSRNVWENAFECILNR